MAREPLIAWRNRHNPDGLQPYCRVTGRNGTLVGATGLSIARRWFFGLMTFRLDEHLNACVVIGQYGQATDKPRVSVGVHSRTGMIGVYDYPDDDAGNAEATQNGRSLAHISGLRLVDRRATEMTS